MNRFISALLFLSIVLMTPAWADYKMKQYYVAVFVSKEFAHEWTGFYSPDLLTVAEDWDDLEGFCQRVAEKAGNKPIVIDLDVHGEDDGLYVTKDFTPKHTYDNAKFGFVVNKIYNNLKGRSVTILCEACFVGNAYYYTIRNNHTTPEDDFLPVCPFPIYGVGSGFSNWGNTVYLQKRNGILIHYEDVRLYEIYQPNAHEPEFKFLDGLSPTTVEMKDFYEFYESKY